MRLGDQEGHPSAQWDSKPTNKGVRENMKLSVEMKVAGAIAAGFVTLTAIGIGQGNSEGQTRVRDGYGPANNPRINTHISQQESDSGLQPTLWVDAIRL